MTAGGLGRELFGDPMGGGGPISVARALAVDGRTVRVVFTEAPVFATPAGLRDAMNPANYLFSVAPGTPDVTAPEATVVRDALVVGPARGVGNAGAAAERGVDVGVDRALVVGATYVVRVQLVAARAGGALGAPTSAAFFGIARPVLPATPGGRPLDAVDVAFTPFSDDGWTADDSGDLANSAGLESYRKRVLRILTTPQNAYSFLPGFGTGLRLKEVGGLAAMSKYKTDAELQIGRDPETQSVRVDVSTSGTNLTVVNVTAVRRRTGDVVTAGLSAGADGTIQVF